MTSPTLPMRGGEVGDRTEEAEKAEEEEEDEEEEEEEEEEEDDVDAVGEPFPSAKILLRAAFLEDLALKEMEEA